MTKMNNRYRYRQPSLVAMSIACCLLLSAVVLGCRPVQESNSKSDATSTNASSQPIQGASPKPTTDFEKAFREVKFSLSADDNGPSGENGIPDLVEMALIGHILNSSLDLSKDGGVNANDVQAAWNQAHASASEDVAQHLSEWPSLASLVAGYILIGTEDSFAAINRLSTAFGSPLNGNYDLARQLGRFLGPDGDADGDGFTNRQEYIVFGKVSRDAYMEAAVDSSIRPSSEQVKDVPSLRVTRFRVGILLYPGFEVLDVYGPAEIWGNVSEFDVFAVAEKAGPVRSSQGLETVALYSFETCPPMEILLVPGGHGTLESLKNEKLIAFIKERHNQSTWTSSVCTGSALLAKAGILDGLRATSNKAFFSIATNQSSAVQWVENARWVEDGKVFTSSGVSAGTDMAVALVAKIFGKERAKELAAQLEYQWHEDANDDPFASRLRR
jgi:putative intracellular protease/amidase